MDTKISRNDHKPEEPDRYEVLRRVIVNYVRGTFCGDIDKFRDRAKEENGFHNLERAILFLWGEQIVGYPQEHEMRQLVKKTGLRRALIGETVKKGHSKNSLEWFYRTTQKEAEAYARDWRKGYCD